MTIATPQPLILTLKLDQPSFAHFDQLRQQYFPPERSFLPAHVTLFHALPGEQEFNIRQVLQALCAETPLLSLSFPTLRFLGKGVAVEVEGLELVQLRQHLAQLWHEGLSRQDRQGYRPHVTVQNKATPEQARQLYEHLLQTWQPRQGTGEGLLLWRYQGGPWELIETFLFQA